MKFPWTSFFFVLLSSHKKCLFSPHCYIDGRLEVFKLKLVGLVMSDYYENYIMDIEPTRLHLKETQIQENLEHLVDT